MNPDMPNTAETIIWTLKDSEGNVVTFKVLNRKAPPQVVVQDENGAVGKYLLVAGRKMWDEYIRQGFVVQNKCVNHDMDKFYEYKKEQESMWMKYNHTFQYHDSDLQEMRMSPKDFYKNYALEA